MAKPIVTVNIPKRTTIKEMAGSIDSSSMVTNRLPLASKSMPMDKTHKSKRKKKV